MIDAPARSVTPTERVIAEMLLENTGAAMMDSGGIYGRAWQTTRAKYGLDGGLPNSDYHGGPGHDPHDPSADEVAHVAAMMRDEPEGYIEEYGEVTVRSFHWLTSRLEYDAELDAKYQRFTRVHNLGKDDYDSEYGMALATAFLELMEKHGGSGGIYPGEEKSLDNAWTNTYNHENSLDRTLQFALFHVEDEGFLPAGSYVLLQIHGGADVRGGYTDPRLFRAPYEQADLFDFDRVEVWCEGADVLPEGVTDGQARLADGTFLGALEVEPETVAPKRVQHRRVQHRWDNHYGDSRLRLVYLGNEWYEGSEQYDEQALRHEWMNDGPVQVLVMDGYRDEDSEPPPETVPLGYAELTIHAIANNATIDESKVWRCPFDGSPLSTSGSIVS